MHLNAYLYEKIIRPRFAVKKYIQKVIETEFDFHNAQVLDFGCGTGSNAHIFQPNNYLGVDIDQTRINFSKKSLPAYKFEMITNNILPVQNQTIDFICILATLHHISNNNIQKYIPEFKRVLKPQGKIVIIEPVLIKKLWFNNWFMKTFDNGKFIRSEEEYKKLFANDFIITVHKTFKKFFFYNELFFSVRHK